MVDQPSSRSRMSSLAPVDPLQSVDDLVPVLDVLRSLRSSGRRRVHALRQLEATLILAYAGQGVPLADLLELKCHEPVLALMGRHTASLIKRGSGTALLPNDDLAQHLRPELDVAVNILQGLCLLSKSCKATAGQMWAMEMFIDLVMLLRSQLSPEGKKTTVYLLLDLLFCILIDAPNNARMFEDLNGLEAVSRVLRGGSVERDVKIKAMEFLHFYLQPEDGAEPALPSGSTSAAGLDTGRYQTPEPQSFVTEGRRSGSTTPHESDLPFTPQTPRKPPKQTLGFQTPSARRFERDTSANSSGTSLAPVPPSPRSDDESDGSLTKRDSAAWLDAQRKMDARADRVSSASSEFSQASNVSSSGSSSSSSTVVQKAGQIGANTRSRHRQSVSTSAVLPSPAISRSSSRSSRAPSSELSRAPSSAGDKSSSGFGNKSSASSSLLSKPKATTQHSLDTDPGLLARRASRPSKSPLAQSTTPEEVARRAGHLRVHSAAPLGTPNPTRSSSSTPAVQRSKGFPSELTKGHLPNSSSTALTPSRRVLTGTVGEDGQRVRPVSDKKLMLAEYVANVDQLVEGAEKMGLSTYKPY
ncbi:uncharacterized protein CcaverHIS019_0201570 [Cutaneotrichosporon cavernicola]|uniref:CDC14-domain-containing protein n=1 Tax=Cutaneotrichosporon cavernicola TaxID=279322 RepID=A0AA48I6K2_9TREE|nr:uncharacterized protein CcaverHIS019_0201570 [Cutaneotrichosporon cavernicola]BEI88795.1 hypothetical protein CcaverHIS019_0201570 [Cutaneotrichosporon cavernicola]BEI96570.1 hypothetical protein CcaverHIS631_0201590 [Cutaneotrichosporon cavernicola]BEJ04343.1 hypothetical protein CcaverHIS641_0201600 [Cutaneotrichosporon cavernicola]